MGHEVKKLGNEALHVFLEAFPLGIVTIPAGLEVSHEGLEASEPGHRFHVGSIFGATTNTWLYTGARSGARMTPNLTASGALNRDAILCLLRESYPELKARYGVRQIGLFGSFASDTANEASDVDLVVDFDRPIGLRFIELVEHLEGLLGRKVDVLTSAGLRGIRLPVVARRIEESVIHV